MELQKNFISASHMFHTLFLGFFIMPPNYIIFSFSIRPEKVYALSYKMLTIDCLMIKDFYDLI